MQIQSSGGIPTSNSQPAASSARAADLTASSVPTTKSSGAEAYSPTAGLNDLLAQIQLAPDVRQEVVQQALLQVANGELNTPAAAADTAKSFLRSFAQGN